MIFEPDLDSNSNLENLCTLYDLVTMKVSVKQVIEF